MTRYVKTRRDIETDPSIDLSIELFAIESAKRNETLGKN